MNTYIPWYVAGPLIGLMVPLLLILRGKQLGISSSFRFIGSIFLNKVDYFKGSKQQDLWQVFFVIGLVFAGVLSSQIYQIWSPLIESKASIFQLEELEDTVYTFSNWGVFLLGGFLLGYGSRYANGCTAGHCIMGVSQFSMSSIIATIFFFVGGLVATFLINPYLFNL